MLAAVSSEALNAPSSHMLTSSISREERQPLHDHDHELVRSGDRTIKEEGDSEARSRSGRA